MLLFLKSLYSPAHSTQLSKSEFGIADTDESYAYNRIPDSGRERQTVCHSQNEYARDEDQDGCCEIHCNTMD